MADDFASKLQSLVSLEVSKGTIHDPEKMGSIIETLASSLGFTVALAAGGDPERANHLLEGLNNYLIVTASERAPLAKMICASKVMRND